MKLIKTLETRLAGRFNVEYHTDGEDIPDEWTDYPLCYLGYGDDRESCVREGSIFSHDDLMQSIIDEFYEYWAALAKVFEDKHQLKEGEARITVMPSWEDHTYFVVTCKGKVVLEDSCKAWNFAWESPDELEASLQEDFKAMEKNFYTEVGQ